MYSLQILPDKSRGDEVAFRLRSHNTGAKYNVRTKLENP